MKAAHLAVGLVAFVGGGAASFVVTRDAIGNATRGGVATREGLVAATIEGVNAGDREALLDIMVGPASDRVAAACDDEGEHDAEARDQRRGERVDDALGEAKRRKLVVDRVGDDHAEVVAKGGDEIDKHCKSRIDVVKHDMELALHDTKGVAYTAHLTAIEIAGRWYLSKIPIAAETKPVAVAPPVAPTPSPSPPVAAAPSTPAPTVAHATESRVLPLHNLDDVLDKMPAGCATYVKELERLYVCTHDAKTHEALGDAMIGIKGAMKLYVSDIPYPGADRELLTSECKKGLDMLHKGLFGC